MKKEKTMKILSILLATVIVFSPIHAAKKSVKLAKDSYHQICKDLNDNILKPGKKLSRAEKKAVNDYLGAKKTSRLKKRDLTHFENAIKKHKFIKVTKSKNILVNSYPVSVFFMSNKNTSVFVCETIVDAIKRISIVIFFI